MDYVWNKLSLYEVSSLSWEMFRKVFPQDVAKEILILAKGHGSSLDGLLGFFQLYVSSFLGSVLLRNSPIEAQVSGGVSSSQT